MDNTSAGLTYALLILPVAFSLVVVGQGIYKMKKNEKSGPITLGLGICFLLLVPLGYFLFIRI